MNSDPGIMEILGAGLHCMVTFLCLLAGVMAPIMVVQLKLDKLVTTVMVISCMGFGFGAAVKSTDVFRSNPLLATPVCALGVGLTLGSAITIKI